MSRNRVELNQQIHKIMLSMRAYGQSRAVDKENREDRYKIYSYTTFDTYTQHLEDFTKYLKEKHNVKNISEITQKMGIDYIKQKEENGISAYSYSTAMAAINKVLDLKLTKKLCNVMGRALKDITRSRGAKAMDLKYNESNYKDQILMAKATGIRRESMTRC